MREAAQMRMLLGGHRPGDPPALTLALAAAAALSGLAVDGRRMRKEGTASARAIALEAGLRRACAATALDHAEQSGTVVRRASGRGRSAAYYVEPASVAARWAPRSQRCRWCAGLRGLGLRPGALVVAGLVAGQVDRRGQWRTTRRELAGALGWPPHVTLTALRGAVRAGAVVRSVEPDGLLLGVPEWHENAPPPGTKSCHSEWHENAPPSGTETHPQWHENAPPSGTETHPRTYSLQRSPDPQTSRRGGGGDSSAAEPETAACASLLLAVGFDAAAASRTATALRAALGDGAQARLQAELVAIRRDPTVSSLAAVLRARLRRGPLTWPPESDAPPTAGRRHQPALHDAGEAIRRQNVVAATAAAAAEPHQRLVVIAIGRLRDRADRGQVLLELQAEASALGLVAAAEAAAAALEAAEANREPRSLVPLGGHRPAQPAAAATPANTPAEVRAELARRAAAASQAPQRLEVGLA